jgi:cell division protein FtsZ
MGYDNTLEDRIGITLIATGFEHKDPFAKPVPKKEEPKPEEKIVMVLGQQEEAPVIPISQKMESAQPVVNKEMIPEVKAEVTPEVKVNPLQVAAKEEDYLMPKLVEEFPVAAAPVLDLSDIREAEEPMIIHWELEPEAPATVTNINVNVLGNSTVGKMSTAEQPEEIISNPLHASVPPVTIKETDAEMILSLKDSTSSTSPVSAVSGGYLARPSNIYAETKTEATTSKSSAEEPVPATKKPASVEQEELLDLQMQLVERDDIPAADMPMAHQAHQPLSTNVEDLAMQDEAEEQKRRAAERLHKLRNLSFNVNAADPNNEFETVPAYIRRNMELYNSNSHIESFYSSYEVKSDEKNQGHISTINTFLDGKKPD